MRIFKQVAQRDAKGIYVNGGRECRIVVDDKIDPVRDAIGTPGVFNQHSDSGKQVDRIGD
ncbi:MAG: hypothetical protein ABIQ30_14650 [Devosia sp.]